MTTCYTFNVTMKVQVLSEDDVEGAKASLDQHGGYISERNVELISSIQVGEDKGFKVIDGEKE